jgi:hypothetical protein
MRERVVCRIFSVVVIATFGCASSAYAPRPSHRISFVASDGSAKLVRDSQTFGIWDLDQAVAGNPEAESNAHAFKQRTIGGFVLDIAGLGLGAGGLASVGEVRSPSTTRRAVGFGIAGVGMVSLIAAVALLTSGTAHFYDAINIYNDSVPPDANR